MHKQAGVTRLVVANGQVEHRGIQFSRTVDVPATARTIGEFYAELKLALDGVLAEALRTELHATPGQPS